MEMSRVVGMDGFKLEHFGYMAHVLGSEIRQICAKESFTDISKIGSGILADAKHVAKFISAYDLYQKTDGFILPVNMNMLDMANIHQTTLAILSRITGNYPPKVEDKGMLFDAFLFLPHLESFKEGTNVPKECKAFKLLEFLYKFFLELEKWAEETKVPAGFHGA